MVLLPGNVFPGLLEAFQVQLVRFVHDGGTLICLPFVAWSAEAFSSELLADLLPVRCEGFTENLDLLIDPSA